MVANSSIISVDLDTFLSSNKVSINELTNDEQNIIKLARELDGCWLAGGAALAIYTNSLDKIKDWDLFFETDEARKKAHAEITSLGFNKTLTSKWSISYIKNDIIVQLITIKNYSCVEEIFKNFDISVCCFAIEENTLCYTAQSKADVERKLMNFIDTKAPVICIKRIAKYAVKGFKPTTNFAMDFISAMRDLDSSQIVKMEGIEVNSNGDS